jgi:hypothetical protein
MIVRQWLEILQLDFNHRLLKFHGLNDKNLRNLRNLWLLFPIGLISDKRYYPGIGHKRQAYQPEKEQHFDARTEIIKIGGLFWLSLTFVRGRRGIIL